MVDSKAIRGVAVQLNRGAVRGSSAHLAKIMGVSVQMARAWRANPESNENHRRMTHGARRLLATMVLLDSAGLLDDKFIAAVDTVDRLLKEGDTRLDQAIAALDAARPLDEDEVDEE